MGLRARLAVRWSDPGVPLDAQAPAGISVRDAAGGEIARLADDVGVTTAATWAADGSFLLTSSPGGATIWASDGWQVVRTLASGGGGMLPVAPSPDGSRIALGWDHHVSLWSADEAEAPALEP